MDHAPLAKRFWRWLNLWVWTLTDALPPYGYAEGPLDAKEGGGTGKRYIRVDSARIEVDPATYDMLEEGEMLRVRYTRGHRAVNIDRLRPPDLMDEEEDGE